jgi:hypothetical protein
MQKKFAIIAASFCLVFVLAGCGQKNADGQKANNQQQNQEQNRNREQANSESLAACSGKSEGDSCETTTPKMNANEEAKTMSGTCKKMQDEKIACVPVGGGPNNGERPNGPNEQGPNASQE